MFCNVTENIELGTPYIHPACEYTFRLPELCTCCYCQPLDLPWKLTGNEKVLSILKIMKYSEYTRWILHCFFSRSQDRHCVIIIHYNNSIVFPTPTAIILASLKGSLVHTLELDEQILSDNTALSANLMPSRDNLWLRYF